MRPISRACDRLGAAIAKAFQASMPMFEGLVAKCSFRKCAFADAATRMIGDAEGTVIGRMIALDLLPAPPDQPSGDWGVFLLLH